MKFRNPETGEFEELYTKAADTLPVGTEVDYDGDEVPAGWEEITPIVESGSNENGSWTKWADGTMICEANYYIESAINNTWGSLYISNEYPLKDFPVPFVGKTPTVVMSHVKESWAQYHLLMRRTTQTLTNAGNVVLVSPVQLAQAQGGTINIIAKGKWK